LEEQITMPPESWGPLWTRYQDVNRPHKLLALDGGGIRGLITLGILREIEKKLAESTGLGNSFRLGEWFDYVGGTSTGAIIAAGLARGMTANELISFYRDSGKAMFEKTSLLKRLSSFYQADPLREKLQNVFGAQSTLEPQYLKCLLLVVTQNITTDSPWPISSNPNARYNDTSRADCNLRIPLWQLVRASTAAPVYFPPEVLNWDKTDPSKTFIFVDGGMTPYNNPAFLIYRMATAAPYHLNWKAGEKNLLVVSVGTGSAGTPSFKANTNLVANVAGIPGHLMYAIANEQDINCRTVGRCTYGPWIDGELFDMTCRDAQPGCNGGTWLQAPHRSLDDDLGRAFLYARYNADLSREGLDLMGFKQMQPEDVQKLDSVDHMDDLLAVGSKAGEQVDVAHFGSFA
jgi:hypothetical protein